MSGFLFPLTAEIQHIQTLTVFAFLQTWSQLLPNHVDKKSISTYLCTVKKADFRNAQSFYCPYFQRGLFFPNWNPIIAERLQVVLLPGTEYFQWDIEDRYYGIHCKMNSWGLCPVSPMSVQCLLSCHWPRSQDVETLLLPILAWRGETYRMQLFLPPGHTDY